MSQNTSNTCRLDSSYNKQLGCQDRHDLPTTIFPNCLVATSDCGSTLSVSDERHYLFECPELHMARAQCSSLFNDAQGSMRSLVWHKNQAAVSQFLAAVLRRIETLNTISSS